MTISRNTRLGGFYFFYFAALGALWPYWSLYLDALGFAPVTIGVLLGVMQGMRVLAPGVWGWLADATGKRLLVIRLATGLAVAAFCGLFIRQDFVWLLVVTALFSFFWSAALPQFEAATLEHLGRDATRYSRIRLWGSVGFILAVLGAGWGLDLLAARYLPWLVVLLFVAVWLVSLHVPDTTLPAQHAPLPVIWPVLRAWPVAALFIACFLNQLAHGPYYGFFSLYLAAHDYSGAAIGQLWALGVVAEIGVFIAMPQLLARFSLAPMFCASLLLAAVRWLLIGLYVDKIAVLLFAQCLHLASFGLLHAVAMAYIHRWFPGRLRGRGQALYSSLWGAGGALGNLACGYLWGIWQPGSVFLLAALVAGSAFFVAATGLLHEQRNKGVLTT